MGKENNTFGNLALKEVTGPTAFRIKEGERGSAGELRDDLLSYLGEYRFKLSTYDYKLLFTSIDGKFHLRDKHRLEPMVTKAKRAVNERVLQELPIERELAEEAGLKKLDKMLSFAGEDCNIVWASPPGLREQGYGDYGFVFVGKIKKISKTEKKIDMTAIRVESPSMDQFNKVLSEISGKEYGYKTAEEFLANPVILRGVEDKIEPALNNFTIEDDLLINERFKRITEKMEPLIERFIKATSIEERMKLFNTIENYTIELERKETPFFFSEKAFITEAGGLNIGALVSEYGNKKAPTVQGSCGSSGTQSNNIFNNLGSITPLLNRESNSMNCVKCPFCHETVNAELTESKITCPKCKESANR
ncbi:MAG: hypothetical protein V1697_00310 [Candidatus Levyibacteriota bacterium]